MLPGSRTKRPVPHIRSSVQVTWWEGEADPERAAIVLHYRGYDLHLLDPADPDSSGDGDAPGESPLTGSGSG
jgi:hypothetical protein